MVLLLTVAMLVSATLLFAVQPLYFRLVVPLLGGSGAVWITCMVFFQSALMAGYAYVTLLGRLGRRLQVLAHLALLALVAVLLPISLPAGLTPPATEQPAPWLLWLCLTTVGVPFMAVATTSPLLQRWFTWTGHAASSDPYFLYAASNAGSLVGLLGYPLLIEPWLPLARQARLWSLGYLVLVGLIVASGALVLRAAGRVTSTSDEVDLAPATPGPRVWWHPLRWLLLAFVPSSLMLGVTTRLTTDMAAVPMLGVVPLALFLVSFVIAFQRRPWISRRLALRLQPHLLLPLVAMQFVKNVPLDLLALLHLGSFFLTALVCHSELSRLRPPPNELTGFYLWMSLGGVLGGLFNALLAPALFSSVVEYPLALLLACLMRPLLAVEPVGPRARSGRLTPRQLDLLYPLLLGVGLVGAAVLLRQVLLGFGPTGPVLLLAPAGVVCLSFSLRPVRLCLGVGAMLLAGWLLGAERPLHVERSFYGVHRVMLDENRTHTLLFHGSTAHGAERIGSGPSPEPLAYYHRMSPLGQLMDTLREDPRRQAVGVVGLGTGTIAAYGRRGDRYTFYEIDPAVERIAREHFTFLSKSPAALRVVLGDARLSLRQAPDSGFGLLVLDAFSSDAVPVHLLTREAMALYLSKLGPDGLLAFHVSNRYLALDRVLAGLAQDAGLTAVQQLGKGGTKGDRRSPAHWVVVGRRPADLATLAGDRRWQVIAGPGRSASGKRVPRPVLWTDDFSDLLRVLH